MDVEQYNELKMLALKERIHVKDLIVGQISDYIKNHKDGNPQFTIDQFSDLNFIACPAYYRNSTTWDNYCKKQSSKELDSLVKQLLIIEKNILRYL